MLGPSEGAHVIAYLRSLSLGEAEHEQALDEAFSTCVRAASSDKRGLRIDTKMPEDGGRGQHFRQYLRKGSIFLLLL